MRISSRRPCTSVFSNRRTAASNFAAALYQRGGEHFHPVERRVHRAQIEYQRSIDAGIFHMDANNGELSPAGEDGVEPALHTFRGAVTGARGVFALNEFFGSKDQGIRRRFRHRLGCAALADSTAGATRRNARRQQAQCFMQVLVHMGIGSEPFGTPEVCRQASEHGRIHIQKTLDGARGTKDRGEESSGIVLRAGRRQPALKEAAGNLPKKRMLGGNARFREEGNRIERAEG